MRLVREFVLSTDEKRGDPAPIEMLPWEREPYKLWSLWEIMQLEKLSWLVRCIEGLTAYVQVLALAVDTKSKPHEPYSKIRQNASDLCAFAQQYRLRATRDNARRLLDGIDNEVEPLELWHRLTATLREIHGDTKEKCFLYLDGARTTAYDATPAEVFTEEVCNVFPSALYDMRESVKCIALARYTACVFHLMRVLEAPLAAIWRMTGQERDKADNWGQLLSELKKYTDEEERRKASGYQEKVAVLRELHMTIFGIKEVWRNPTIHSIAQQYGADEASEILAYTQRFLGKLIAHIDADGTYTP